MAGRISVVVDGWPGEGVVSMIRLLLCRGVFDGCCCA